LQEEEKDDFITLLEEVIEKIRHEDEYLSFMVGNMAAIVENSEDAIIGIDNDGTILTWNNGAKKMYGYKADEAIGKHISVLMPYENIDELKCLLDKINEDKLICNFETIRKKKNGEKIDVSVTISPIKDSKDIIVGASSIERDITQQKIAEEALKKSEEKYRRLFNDDLTGDFIATLDGNILEYNPAFAEIYGIKDLKEPMKLNISKFNPADWEKLIKRLKTEHKIKGHEIIHQRPDGKDIHVIFNIVAIINELGQFNEVKGYIFEK